MKTAMIARCMFASAAIFAAAGLIGCGAEGSGEPGAVGSTSEALIGAPSALTSVAAGQDFLGQASCYMKNSLTGDQYMVMAGGQTLAPAFTNKVILYTYLAGAGTFTTQSATLSASVSFARAVQIDDETCAIIGGQSGASSYSTNVDILSLTKHTRPTLDTIAVTNATGLTTARAKHGVQLCTDGNGAKHLVAIGGRAASALDSIEVSDSLTPTAWVSYATALNEAKFDFGLAKDYSLANGSNGFVVTGGDTGSARLKTVDLIKFADNVTPNHSYKCEPAVTHVTAINNPTLALADAVAGNVAFYKETTGGFSYVISAAGRISTSSLATKENQLKIDWSGPSISANATTASAYTGTYLPTLVDLDPTNHKSWALVSGSNAAFSGIVTKVQEYVTGSAWTTAATFTQGRVFAPAVFLPTAGKIVVASGEDPTPTDSVLTSAYEMSAP